MTPEATDTPSPLPTLAYGRQRSPRLKRWLKRFLLLLWIAGVLALAWDKWGVLLRVRWDLAMAERELIRHKEPADRIVFFVSNGDNDLGAAGDAAYWWRLPAGEMPTKYRHASYAGFDDRLKTFREKREVAEEYDRIWNPVVDDTIPDFSNAPNLSGYYRETPSLVFAGRRTSAAGATRLVMLKSLWVEPAHRLAFSSEATPAGLTGPAVGPSVYHSTVESLSIAVPADGFIRIHAGRPDPADSAAVRIRYVTEAGEGEVVARLGADDNVSFEIASGPLKGRERPPPKTIEE